MKTQLKNYFKITIAIVLMSVTMFACSSDDDSSGDYENNTQEIAAANTITTSGSWVVSNYTDDGNDETGDYTGYVFTFNESGTLIATNGTTEVEGTWSIQNDDSSSSDDDDDDIDFNILFPVPEDNVFDDLSDDWDLLSITANTISLRDVSGGDGSVDLLTFSRN